MPATEEHVPMQYCISFHPEDGYNGRFPTREAAIAEAVAACEDDERKRFWIGEVGEPYPPGQMFSAAEWIETVYNHDDYCPEFADETLLKADAAKLAELDAEVAAVMAAWMKRHGLTPKHYTVESAEAFIFDGDGRAAPAPDGR